MCTDSFQKIATYRLIDKTAIKAFLIVAFYALSCPRINELKRLGSGKNIYVRTLSKRFDQQTYDREYLKFSINYCADEIYVMENRREFSLSLRRFSELFYGVLSFLPLEQILSRLLSLDSELYERFVSRARGLDNVFFMNEATCENQLFISSLRSHTAATLHNFQHASYPPMRNEFATDQVVYLMASCDNYYLWSKRYIELFKESRPKANYFVEPRPSVVPFSLSGCFVMEKGVGVFLGGPERRKENIKLIKHVKQRENGKLYIIPHPSDRFARVVHYTSTIRHQINPTYLTKAYCFPGTIEMDLLVAGIPICKLDS